MADGATSLAVAVVMRREPVPGAMRRWQPWRWLLEDVVAQQPALGEVPRCLQDEGLLQRWLYPGLPVSLHRDEAEGYALNLASPAPCWFVHWRLDEEPDAQGLQLARPLTVTLSYHEAGRWLDAQESVEQVPAPAEVLQWLQAFAEQHRPAEEKRRQRPQSFRGLSDRFGNPASVSTGKGRDKGGS